MKYQFSDPALLIRALTHKSFANENRTSHNEVLEFLGDSVVNLVVGELLMKHFPQDEEGALSKKRASLVNESTLCELAIKLEIPEKILLGRGERKSDQRRPRILASALEALFGALYLDGGFEKARAELVDLFEPVIQGRAWDDDFSNDFKTRLQETIQKKNGKTPIYQVVQEEGPDHQKIFQVEVLLDEAVLGRGTGKSKKMAEQAAASMALGTPQSNEGSLL